MYLLACLSIYTLLCAACEVDNGYSSLTTRAEVSITQSATVLLPESITEVSGKPATELNSDGPHCGCQFHLNPSHNPDVIVPSAAATSGGDSNTLPSDGEEETNNIPPVEQGTASSTLIGSTADTTEINSVTRSSDETTGLPPTEKTTDIDFASSTRTPGPALTEHTSISATRTGAVTNSNEPTSDGTTALADFASTSDAESKQKSGSATTTSRTQPSHTTLMRSTTSSSVEAVPSENIGSEDGQVEQSVKCYGNDDLATVDASRIASATSFCDRFSKTPLTLQGWHEESKVKGIAFGVNFSKSSSQSCDEYKVDDVVCRRHLLKIEHNCGRLGGFVIGQCVLVWADPSLDGTA
ncbi:uncharacterized protein FTOL_06458 [Fusarium torulosum]|uniref:Uncharacterized protein n=1 Tax=Fusarium torulosum TaxID=33205 RepID=A0AAE8SI33_9HYPO|nr:uncharacterized protein FTOL_06458 [Fusarium torulosum]